MIRLAPARDRSALPEAGVATLADPGLEGEWQRRLRAVPGATVFAGPLFQRAIRAAFPDRARGDAIVVRRNGALAGLLPLTDLPLRQGPFVLHESGFARNAHTLRNNLLVADDPHALAALLAGWRSQRGTDSLLLENLPVADGLAEHLADGARAAGLLADAPTPGRTLDHADLPPGYDGYLATRSGQMRRQLRTKRRDLEAAGRFTVEALDGSALTAAIPDWRAVAAASWQARDPAGANGDADWALHAALAGNGRLWLARLDGRAVATLRMLEDERAVYVHTMHYDQALRELAPGVVVFDAMMRDACERGVPRVDFNGRTEFFARWATGTTEHLSIRLYRPGPRGRVAQAIRRWRRRPA